MCIRDSKHISTAAEGQPRLRVLLGCARHARFERSSSRTNIGLLRGACSGGAHVLFVKGHAQIT
eukprot:3745355-Alexandrium_andersonii.AAC.1